MGKDTNRGPWIVAAMSVVMGGTLIASISMAVCDSSHPSPSTPAPSVSPVVAAPAVAATTAEAPDPSEVRPAPLAGQLARLDLALLELDVTLHAVRIEWTGRVGGTWRWPHWLNDAAIGSLLRELEALAHVDAGAPTLDAAIAAYAATLAHDLPRLRALHQAWTQPDGATDAAGRELVERFDRLGQVSLAVRAVARGADHTRRAPSDGSLPVLLASCARAAGWLAELPAVAPRPRAEADGVVAPPSRGYLAAPDLSTMGADARACLRAAADYLDRHPDGTVQVTYLGSLATSIATNLLQERDRRAARPAQLTTAGNLAQVSAYFARQCRTLEPAWALAPPPPR